MPDTPNDTASDALRNTVRTAYAATATGNATLAEACCAPAASGDAGGCCGPSTALGAAAKSQDMGYAAADLDLLPEGADLGLGCGNPTAVAELAPGETVIDLGAGAGIDCFIAAHKVGDKGRVIGVDMTPEMVSKARANAARSGLGNVEFRLGEIEHLPVADGTADAIISNCVVNLSPEKAQVFQEAHRVLKPGGRVRISDVVATRPLPDGFRDDAGLVCGCMGGAAEVGQIETWLAEAGFTDIAVEVSEASRAMIAGWAPGTGIEDYVASAVIRATRPG